MNDTGKYPLTTRKNFALWVVPSITYPFALCTRVQNPGLNTSSSARPAAMNIEDEHEKESVH